MRNRHRDAQIASLVHEAQAIAAVEETQPLRPAAAGCDANGCLMPG
ncbi:hypothetical protein MMG85_14830 [Pseudoxanthomonas sp. LH2527]|nr:hypothetical protein [Pseudoxanthomonas sp. LH2527]MCH6484824.1 hypothetical protein [Pseudoxanthomonas sp. LH2527]